MAGIKRSSDCRTNYHLIRKVERYGKALEQIEARLSRIAAGEFGGLEAAKDLAAVARRALEHVDG